MFSSKSSEIADLQSRLTAVQAEKDLLTTANAAATAERDEAIATASAEKTRADKAEFDLAAAVTSLAAEKAAAEQARADLAAAKEAQAKAIDAEVINRLAAAGSDPVARDPKVTDSNSGTQSAGAGLTGIAKARALLTAKHITSN